MRRRRSILALAACLLLGACAHDTGSGRGQQNGFYGGFSGGTATP